MLLDIIQIATLLVIITYTFITKKLLTTQKMQSFENAFFTMMDHHTKILNSIALNITDRRDNKQRIEGIEVFAHLKTVFINLYKLALTFEIMEKKRLIILLNYSYFNKNELEEFYSNAPRKNVNEINNNKKAYFESIIVYTYNFMFEKFYDHLGHYFRHLYNVLKYIEYNEKHLKKLVDIKLYPGLVQAMLCSSELFILFYDGLKFHNMKKYINQYNLIENLAIDDLADILHKDFYSVKMKSRKDQIAK